MRMDKQALLARQASVVGLDQRRQGRLVSEVQQLPVVACLEVAQQVRRLVLRNPHNLQDSGLQVLQVVAFLAVRRNQLRLACLAQLPPLLLAGDYLEVAALALEPARQEQALEDLVKPVLHQARLFSAQQARLLLSHSVLALLNQLLQALHSVKALQERRHSVVVAAVVDFLAALHNNKLQQLLGNSQRLAVTHLVALVARLSKLEALYSAELKPNLQAGACSDQPLPLRQLVGYSAAQLNLVQARIRLVPPPPHSLVEVFLVQSLQAEGS